MTSCVLNRFQKLKQHLGKLWTDKSSADDWISFTIRTGIILAMFVAIDRLCRGMTHLSEEIYESPVILIGLVRRIFSSYYGIVVLVVVLVGVHFRRRLLFGWSSFEHFKVVRLMCLLAAGLLTWEYVTYPYNLYFDQAYYPDRICILILFGLMVWRPVFTLPFILELLAFKWQMIPVGNSWAAMSIPMGILILFVVLSVLHITTRARRTGEFIFLMCCLFAAHYWVPGFGKVDLSWLLHNRFYYALSSSMTLGWLADMDPETISTLAKNMSAINEPMKVFTLFAECGSILFFWGRRYARIIIITWVLMHIGIYLLFGFCFWLWSALDIALLVAVTRKGFGDDLGLFQKSRLLVGIPIIFLGSYWCHPNKFAWIESPVTYGITAHATLQSGNTVELPARFFGPYADFFALSYLPYLVEQPMVKTRAGYGKEELQKVRKLFTLKSSAEVINMEQSDGTVFYNEQETERLLSFIREYIAHWNVRRSIRTPFSVLRPPGFLQTHPWRSLLRPTEQIIKVDIILKTTVFANFEHIPVRHEILHTVNAPD